MRKVELNRHYAYVIVFQSPYIRVFSFIEIYKGAAEPEIIFSMRVFSFIKFFFVLRISLFADLDAFDDRLFAFWYVYIQAKMFVERFAAQHMLHQNTRIFFCAIKIGLNA